ncbi:DUF1996 domain-containing protein [Streptomyces sp. NBC_01304]|uniref:DUF1996 domain-containing protein n=1 Tax=Streptomyces sp. NBC_01304 TaxID=2903818 RepID=UPI002E115668|nr:DUF1996 domain-containing protein [Streptomyces sp. NBC_01304]
MGRTSRKRSKLAGRAIAASAALILGGGGLAVVNVYASAEEGIEQPPAPQESPENSGQQLSTIDCPEVGNELTDVPEGARAEVDRQLAALDTQISEAYEKFAEDPNAAQDAVLGPLEEQRRASIEGITGAIEQAGGTPPEVLDGLAPCTLRADGSGSGSGDDATAPPVEGNGPAPEDFVDIKSVRPNVQLPRNQRGASRGNFTTKCGTNENGKRNPDNVIVAPGVSNGAHHMHDYVGNQANDAFASDDDLANGQTTCRNRGDRSTYYWPVLRVRTGEDESDVGADGGGKDQNTGKIQTPATVSLKFVGSPAGKVTAMPRLLRIITGDAKAFVNGNANANASWSCTGFENRQLKDKYPLCPDGSKVVRTFRFQSCWDGRNTDSANHRTHVAFADPRSGACPQGFKAIPQLVQRIVYDVDAEPNFALDSFPEQLHKPVTDHGDFINVFDARLMNRMVSCINRGDRCR